MKSSISEYFNISSNYKNLQLTKNLLITLSIRIDKDIIYNIVALELILADDIDTRIINGVFKDYQRWYYLFKDRITNSNILHVSMMDIRKGCNSRKNNRTVITTVNILSQAFNKLGIVLKIIPD